MPSAIALFARAPELGKVKTRLARTRGDEFALALYRAMLGDTLELMRRAREERELRLLVFLSPDESELTGWRGETRSQGDGDLWTRLLRADARLREEGFERIVFIGADSPDLPLALLGAAFDCLEERPVVVGPSLDGGFYLLGSARRLPDEVFQQVPVSSRDTLAHLTQNLRKLAGLPGWDYRTLAAWRDVDDETDLQLLLERLRQNPHAAPRCRAFLLEQGVL
jgi:rSAM/selenodomain-associated transferase 1